METNFSYTQNSANQSPFSVKFYQIAFYLLLAICLLLVILIFVLFNEIKTFTQLNLPEESQIQKTIELTPIPTAVPTLKPTSTPKPVRSITATPTPTPAANTTPLTSSLCPVTFTVPAGRIYINAKNQYGTWQIIERPSERFMYLPRAEETNGREAELQLRAEGQVYGNGELELSVHCQDNPNKWGQEDFLTYIKKTDDLINSPYVSNINFSRVNLWGRDVIYLTFTNRPSEGTVTDITEWNSKIWLFATPNLLFHVTQTVYNSDYQKDLDAVFNSLKFF